MFKLEIPAELRQQIEDCQAELRAAVSAAAEEDGEIAGELGALEKQEAELTGAVERLTPEALGDDGAATQLATAETRLRLIRQKADAVRATAASRRGVTLAGAQPVLVDIARFYLSALPEAIADHNAGLTCNRALFLQVIRLLDCFQELAALRTAAIQMPSMIANEKHLAWLFAIFGRALRGQPHLGFDFDAEEETRAADQQEAVVA
jgi:hypothetical protein